MDFQYSFFAYFLRVSSFRNNISALAVDGTAVTTTAAATNDFAAPSIESFESAETKYLMSYFGLMDLA